MWLVSILVPDSLTGLFNHRLHYRAYETQGSALDIAQTWFNNYLSSVPTDSPNLAFQEHAVGKLGSSWYYKDVFKIHVEPVVVVALSYQDDVHAYRIGQEHLPLLPPYREIQNLTVEGELPLYVPHFTIPDAKKTKGHAAILWNHHKLKITSHGPTATPRTIAFHTSLTYVKSRALHEYKRAVESINYPNSLLEFRSLKANKVRSYVSANHRLFGEKDINNYWLGGYELKISPTVEHVLGEDRVFYTFADIGDSNTYPHLIKDFEF